VVVKDIQADLHLVVVDTPVVPLASDRTQAKLPLSYRYNKPGTTARDPNAS
jgi:hypothetical protein